MRSRRLAEEDFLKYRWIGLILAIAAAITVLWLAVPGRREPFPPQAEAANTASPDAAATTRQLGPPPEASAPTAVVSRTGVPLHLVQRARIGAIERPYAKSYQELEPAARAGDVVAQYRLGLLLYACRDVPADEQGLERAIDAVYQTRSRGPWDVESPADEEQSMRRSYEECIGVPADARPRYREWLKRAADAGLIEAQLGLPRHLPQGEYCQFMSDCPPEQRALHERLQEEAIDYLGRARDAGSAMALWTFGAWFEQGEVLPKNDVEAYAHFLALDDIVAAAGQSRRFGAMLETLRERLRPIDLQQAEVRARELLSNPNCCVLTDG